MEESLAKSGIGAKEKKHEQGFKGKHVMGSSNAQAKGRTVERVIDMFSFLLCKYISNFYLCQIGFVGRGKYCWEEEQSTFYW